MTEAQGVEVVALLGFLVQLGQLALVLLGGVAFAVFAHLFMEYVSS
jgi:hypothetical protein